MTVGEKLQSLRKQYNMSQENLANKMFVSRQTVSLWENNQTQPSIDNLLLLKQIFNVTIDELLGEEHKEPDIQSCQQTPKESYVFSYNKKESKKLYMDLNRKSFNKILLVIIISFILAVLSATTGEKSVNGSSAMVYFSFCVIYLIVYIKKLITLLRLSKDTILQNKEYQYDVFDDHIKLSVRQNGRVLLIRYIDYSEIEKIESTNDFCIFSAQRQFFPLKKSEINENSAIYYLLTQGVNKYKAKLEAPKTPKQRKFESILLKLSKPFFVMSVLSVLMAMLLVSIISQANNKFIDNMWVFFLFLIIPFASIFIGIKMKIRKNTVVGIIMAITLTVYGTFSFVVQDIQEDELTYVQETLLALDITIPQPTNIIIIDPENEPYYNETSYSTVTFNAEETLNSEDMSVKWLTELNDKTVDFLSKLSYNGIYSFDYYYIYNKTTKTDNQIEPENNNCEYIYLAYSKERNKLMIYEFEQIVR